MSSTELVTISEWGLLQERPYARPRYPYDGKAEVVSVHLASPPIVAASTRRPAVRASARALRPPTVHSSLLAGPSHLPAVPELQHPIPRPVTAYVPQSLDAVMFHDLRTYRRNTPAVSSPLAKGVVTLIETPPTPPASPTPEEETLSIDSRETIPKEPKTSILKTPMKFLKRSISMSFDHATSKAAATPPNASRSAPASLRRKDSSVSRHSTRSQRHTPTLPPLEDDPATNWMTVVATPTFSRYQLGANVVLPVSATERTPSRQSVPRSDSSSSRQSIPRPESPSSRHSVPRLKSSSSRRSIHADGEPPTPGGGVEKGKGKEKENTPLEVHTAGNADSKGKNPVPVAAEQAPKLSKSIRWMSLKGKKKPTA